MEHSEFINELAAALSKAQGAMEAAPRNAQNPFFKSSYADLASIMATVRKPLSENGLAVIQIAETTESGVVVTTMLTHSSGQWISGSMSTTAGEERGLSCVQVMGKIVTYLRRYGFGIVGVVTDDDDDGNSAQGKPAQPKPQPAPKAEAPKPSETIAASAPLTENIPGNHWIDDDATRKKFWAYTRDTLGLTDKEVYAALGVEHIHGYAGDKAAALEAIRKYVQHEAAVKRVETVATGVLGIDLAEEAKHEVEQLAASLGGVVAK